MTTTTTTGQPAGRPREWPIDSGATSATVTSVVCVGGYFLVCASWPSNATRRPRNFHFGAKHNKALKQAAAAAALNVARNETTTTTTSRKQMHSFFGKDHQGQPAHKTFSLSLMSPQKPAHPHKSFNWIQLDSTEYNNSGDSSVLWITSFQANTTSTITWPALAPISFYWPILFATNWLEIHLWLRGKWSKA